MALDVFDYLEARDRRLHWPPASRASASSLDPGIGFGKRGPQNLAILRALALYHGLGCPILLGASRKALRQRVRGPPAAEGAPAHLPGCAAMHALNLGVQFLRVHDVAETRRVVELWMRLMV